MSTQTASRSLPGAGSRLNANSLPLLRNRQRLIIGAVVLALCALFASVIYGKVGQRESVLALSHDVEQGHIITVNDLKQVDISSTGGLKAIGAEQSPSIVGKVVSTRLLAGSLVTPASAVTATPVSDGNATVGAALKAGQYPNDMRVGDSVLLVTPAEEGAPSSTLPGTVASIQQADREGGSVAASFVIDQDSAAAVGSAGAESKLVVVVLPR